MARITNNKPGYWVLAKYFSFTTMPLNKKSKLASGAGKLQYGSFEDTEALGTLLYSINYN